MINNQKIAEHYAHAVEKHPHFCDLICTDMEKFCAYPQLARERRALDYQDVYENITATQILHTEICEIIDAYARKDYDSAVEECYDAISVLLRMVEFIGKEAAK